MSDDYYVRVIVHGKIPAASAEDALALLCQRLREGLGDDPDAGEREWGIAIGAGAVSLDGDRIEIARVNEEFLRRLRGEPD